MKKFLLEVVHSYQKVSIWSFYTIFQIEPLNQLNVFYITSLSPLLVTNLMEKRCKYRITLIVQNLIPDLWDLSYWLPQSFYRHPVPAAFTYLFLVLWRLVLFLFPVHLKAILIKIWFDRINSKVPRPFKCFTLENYLDANLKLTF